VSTAVVYQMAYFPAAAYEQAWELGLLDASMYRDHADYRREVEQQLQAMSSHGRPMRILALDVPDLIAYAQLHDRDPASRRTRLAYTDWLHGHSADFLPWPPARNADCWCGTGRKYKKCCGSPAFLAAEPPDPASLVLTVELNHVTPRVWRRVAIPSNTTLDRVHRMIQAAMGWEDTHMYVFENDEHVIIDPRSESGETSADGERLVTIATEVGDQFSYTYDFGDEWTHTVTLEEIRPGGPDNEFTVIDGDGACPPEDIGGPYHYQDLLTAYADPTNPDHDDAVEILGKDFDPAGPFEAGDARQR
jgi:hypothetical protein